MNEPTTNPWNVPHIINCLCYRDKPPAMQYPDGGEDPGCLLLRERIAISKVWREAASVVRGWSILDANDPDDSLGRLARKFETYAAEAESAEVRR